MLTTVAALRNALAGLRLPEVERLHRAPEDRGVWVTATASRGVKAGAEAQAVQIPAKLRFELRRGTREYEIPHVFRLYGQLSEKGAPMFRLVHLDRDDAVDAWMRRCLTDVRETLGSQWRVYQGA